MGVSVVIPCYRSARTLEPLMARLTSTLDAEDVNYEVILVVDGCPDGSWEVAERLAAIYEQVLAIRLSRNYGQHNAILAGVREAQYDAVVTMDDDLQHVPEEVPRLLAALSSEVDLVYGVPVEDEHGRARNLASRTVKALMVRALGVRGAGDISAFRAFRTYLRDGFVGLDGPHASVDVALSWATTRVVSSPVRMDKRTEGGSNYSFRLLVRHALNMLLGYSVAPLRMVGYLGVACGLLGVMLLAYVLWGYLTGFITVAGFTTITSMVAIFSGAQMIAMAVIGEYLGRIHERNMGRPTYVIRDRRRRGDP